MPERVEKHGDVHVVVGQPRLERSGGELCPRCGLLIQEHTFLWPKAETDLTLRLFVEACYCGVRFTDAGGQPLDETPELWGIAGRWRCNFCGFATDDQEEFLTHECGDVLPPPDGGAPSFWRGTP
jgi:hypothetical protein